MSSTGNGNPHAHVALKAIQSARQIKEQRGNVPDELWDAINESLLYAVGAHDRAMPDWPSRSRFFMTA